MNKNRRDRRLYMRNLRARNPEFVARQRAGARDYARRKKELINSFKIGPCLDCGNTFHPCAMDFDHVRGEKKYDVSSMQHAKLETIHDEIAKCDLVCANCHRVRTYNRMKVVNPSRHSEVKS